MANMTSPHSPFKTPFQGLANGKWGSDVNMLRKAQETIEVSNKERGVWRWRVSDDGQFGEGREVEAGIDVLKAERMD